MSKVITFSRTFPAYHPKKGQPTYFVEQLQNSLISLDLEWNLMQLPNDFVKSLSLSLHGHKHQTIRAGHRFKVGDYFSPRVWSGKPYNSKQIILAPDIEVKKVWSFKIICQPNSEMPNDVSNFIYVNEKLLMWNDYEMMAKNDGLSLDDFLNWFGIEGDGEECKPQSFDGQIICWNESIKY